MSAPRDERGAILLLTAVVLVGFVGAAAIMVDLAAARNDRAVNQMSADSAATAGAMSLSDGAGPAACASAIAYLDLHIDPPLSGSNCVGFPIVCTDSTPAVTTTASNGDINVTLKHPVDDSDPLMGSALLGAPTVTVSSRDGERCSRVAVVISEERAIFFGAGINDDGGATVVNAVATAAPVESGKTRPINLLALNRTSCQAISVNGGGSGGGIVVHSIIDPATGEVLPGVITADSDGSDCKSNEGVIRANGSKATIRADGPPGCPNELVSGTGQGCGSLEVFAPVGSGCEAPACSGGGVVAPAPQHAERLTRAQVDWAFNCKATYPAALDIPGCPNTPSPAYLDELVAAIGTSGAPIGFRDYEGEGYDCGIGKKDDITVPVGNWWIECDLEIKGSLAFEGGNLVLDGDIELQSSGSLSVNTNNNETLSWWPGASFNHRDHSAEAAYVYFRDGEIQKNAQASLSFMNTMVYMADEYSGFDFGGGDKGKMVWRAPTDGPFNRLALWSEGTNDHELSGGSSVQFEGVVFLPNATLSLQGGGSVTSLDAQFIADKISTGGNGTIELTPSLSSLVQFPVPPTEAQTELIR